jgi:hypothetical protein
MTGMQLSSQPSDLAPIDLLYPSKGIKNPRPYFAFPEWNSTPAKPVLN